MATVTGLTAARMLEIEAASVVSGSVVGDDLFLARHDASEFNAGNVRGPKGDPGSMGGALSVISAVPVKEVGLANQIRAGRQLAPADFTNMGLITPIGLYNLSDANDSSGNARHLTNKGAIPFYGGINGVSTTCANFVGYDTQTFYILDGGVNDPFRIKIGSMGIWFRCAKRGTAQTLLSKMGASGNWAYSLHISANNKIKMQIYFDGTSNPTGGSPEGPTDICDYLWHFVVVVFDGHNLRMYLDGVLEVQTICVGTLFQGSGPFNLGGERANAGTNATNPLSGQIDEAFITSDILSEDQVRNLYCAKITHTLGSVPSAVHLNVGRGKRGGTMVVGDFGTQPDRLYNFTGGVLTDEGSDNTPVVAQGTTTSIFDVAGADGARGNAKSLAGAHQGLASTDASLPAALTSRSYGCWFKLTGVTMWLVQWGTINTADARLYIATSGAICAASGSDTITGPIVNDGRWHLAIVVENNTAADGGKRKLFLDGRLVGVSYNMTSLTLAGALKFRIGADVSGGNVLVGQIDGVFVSSVALTGGEVVTMYNKVFQTLAKTPKAASDHIEAMSSTDLLAAFNSVEGCDQISLAVFA